MTGLRVTKIDKEIEFEGIWGKLQAEKCFHRQSFTKYLRLTPVFMQNSALRGKLNFCFSRAFWWFERKIPFGRRLGTRPSFYGV